MITQEELRGRWNLVKGQLQQRWGQLTEDDLHRANGSTDQLVGLVQEKTGATRREIEEFLSNLLSESGRMGEQVAQKAHHYAETASDYAADAGNYFKQEYRKAAEVSGDYTDKIAHTVRNRPAESLAIAFGLGIAAGALFFMKARR